MNASYEDGKKANEEGFARISPKWNWIDERQWLHGWDEQQIVREQWEEFCDN